MTNLTKFRNSLQLNLMSGYLWLVLSASSSASNWAVTGSHTTWPSTGHVGWECSSQLSIQSLWNCAHKDRVRFNYKFITNLQAFVSSVSSYDCFWFYSMVDIATFQLPKNNHMPNNSLHNKNICKIHWNTVSFILFGSCSF